MKKRRWPLRPEWIGLALVILCGLGLVAGADDLTPEEKGLKIVQEAWEKDVGYGDSSSELVMVLRISSGQESRRDLRIRSLEVSATESRTLVLFDSPRDVRGTALLTHSFTDKEDGQWLYLPAMRRVKRVAGGGRSGPFMGSEFAFEDMGSQRVEKFTYKYVGEETLNDMTCHVIERYPTEAESGYTKQVAWLDTDASRVQKVDYYDRRGNLLKTLTTSEYTLHLDKHWRPGKMEMHNHQNGRSTLLEWKNYSFGNGYTARDFDQNALQSVR